MLLYLHSLFSFCENWATGSWVLARDSRKEVLEVGCTFTIVLEERERWVT